MSAVDDALARDERAFCVNPDCHPTSADRRVLANEVRRLQRMVGLADPEAAARLDASLRRVAREVTEEVLVHDSPVCPYCGMTTWITDHCSLPWCEGFKEVLQ